MIDASQVNQRCVSVGTGLLGPDLRVNYEFGLVLGVDEMRQEQLYQIEHNFLHHRGLHGYGTVFGLNVEVDRPGDDDREVQVSVGRGMGVDQWGRPFVVRAAQCARLGAWLAGQERQRPGTVAEHEGPSGELHVYVVARYDECPEALVPIPGQPCSSSEVTRVPSRIRDAHTIELRWEPPAMPAWDAVRRFGQLMAAVRVDPELPLPDSDEDELARLVRVLDRPEELELLGGIPVAASGIAGYPADVFRLPAATAREALDRLFTIWVTEVRPRIAPDPIAPADAPAGTTADASILLARIDLVPDEPFDPNSPAIADVLPPDDEGRPYLLHTQLIQELHLPGGTHVEVEAPPPPVPAPLPTHNRQLATVDPLILGNAASRLVVWFHTDQPVRLPNQIQVQRNLGGTLLTFTAQPRGGGTFAPVWELTPPAGTTLVNGDLLAIRIPTNTVQVGNAATTLTSVVAAQDRPFLEFDGVGTVALFHILEIPAPAAPPPPTPTIRPAQQLVTLTPIAARGTINRQSVLIVEAWFHLDVDPNVDAAMVADLARLGDEVNRFITVLAETDDALGSGLARLPIRAVGRVQNNVYQLGIDPNAWESLSRQSRYLRLLFDQGLPLETRDFGDIALGDYAERTEMLFAGRQNDDERGPIAAYVRLPNQF